MKQQGWYLVQTLFYTAIPIQNQDQIGANMWNGRLLHLNHDECKKTLRIIRYNGSGRGGEKGTDTRVALDLIRLTLNQRMPQHWSFLKIKILLKLLQSCVNLKKTGDFVRIAEASPRSELVTNKRGINGAGSIIFDIHYLDNYIYRIEIIKRGMMITAL